MASRIQEITVEIGGDTTKLSSDAYRCLKYEKSLAACICELAI